MAIFITRLAPGEKALDELTRFVGELNRDEAHQIGYLDADPAQIAKMLLEHELPPHESWVVAREDGRIVGALGFEADAELGRAWIYGPFVLPPHPPAPSPTGGEGEIPAPLPGVEERGSPTLLPPGVGDKHSAGGGLDGGWGRNPWATIADRLWEAAQALLPEGLREHELFCNIHNINCIAFAERHAFSLHGDALIFRFGRESLVNLPASEAHELTDEHSAAFQALHDQVFPRTYLSGRQILERINQHRKLFAIVEDGALLGYAYVELVPEFGEGNLEFIGVSEQARGKGVGGRLMAMALAWMFSFSNMKEIFLTTNSTNTAAIGLYRKVGFELLHTMRAFRKSVEL
jgi:ribosomal protein S18 acetylase RimI-like enzyme